MPQGLAHHCTPSATLPQDCDDGQWTGTDAHGESAAGGRLLHLLQITDCRGVAVVVTRWFGGVLLGPSRFTHINNAARQLLVECGYIAGKGAKGGGKAGGAKK
jgi:putative IMPACT (imprinted ancient) family translation regulator